MQNILESIIILPRVETGIDFLDALPPAIRDRISLVAQERMYMGRSNECAATGINSRMRAWRINISNLEAAVKRVDRGYKLFLPGEVEYFYLAGNMIDWTALFRKGG